MPQVDDNIAALLEQLVRNQEQFSRALAGLEGRMEQMHEVLRRSAETVTRLKLMADNAKKDSAAQGEILKAVLARIESGAN